VWRKKERNGSVRMEEKKGTKEKKKRKKIEM
jgi:hypothetical protein